jgi:hypothetical protein
LFSPTRKSASDAEVAMVLVSDRYAAADGAALVEVT